MRRRDQAQPASRDRLLRQADFTAATDLATAMVPAAKGAESNTPMGRPRIRCGHWPGIPRTAARSLVRCPALPDHPAPSSRDHRPAGASGPDAATKSQAAESRPGLPRPWPERRVPGQLLTFHAGGAETSARALRKVLASALPTKIVSTPPAGFPAGRSCRTGWHRRGWRRTAARPRLRAGQELHLALHLSHALAETNLGIPAVEACARCAVAKASLM